MKFLTCHDYTNTRDANKAPAYDTEQQNENCEMCNSNLSFKCISCERYRVRCPLDVSWVWNIVRSLWYGQYSLLPAAGPLVNQTYHSRLRYLFICYYGTFVDYKCLMICWNCTKNGKRKFWRYGRLFYDCYMQKISLTIFVEKKVFIYSSK